MRANIELNDELLKQAQMLSKLKTNKEIVNEALDMYVRYLKRKDMLSIAGKIKWEGNLTEMRSAE